VVLVDASIWVLVGVRPAALKDYVAEDEIVTCPPIVQEILQGAHDRRHFETLRAVFTRIAVFGMDPQQAVSAPRWLLGRTWGQTSDSLKLESRFSTGVVADLARRGHEMEVLAEYDETMGHAGAIVRRPDGVLEGGADPRSDGAVAAY